MAYNNNDYEVINTNVEEIGLYLAINLSPQQLKDAELHDYCPTRKHKTGRPPTITGCITENDKKRDFNPGYPQRRYQMKSLVRSYWLKHCT